jgi:bacillolysin
MKKNLQRNWYAIAALSLFSLTISAQEGDRNVKQKITDEKGQVSLIVFNENSSYNSKDSRNIFKEQFNLSDDSEFILLYAEQDAQGFLHEKFQLFHKGIKVEFVTYTLHSKNGVVKSMSGEMYPINDFKIIPTLSAQSAFNNATRHIGATSYLWDNPQEAALAGNYQKPQGEVMIIPVFNDNTSDIKEQVILKLVYKFDIYASQPISRGDVYVDAHTGEVIFYNATIKHANNFGHASFNPLVKKAKFVPEVSKEATKKLTNSLETLVAGTASTRYSGSQTIETTLSGGSYILKDATRGSGVNTYDLNTSTNYASAVNFSDNDNNWTTAEFTANKDNGALDAHWGAEKTFDYWSVKHNRNSFNNAGAAINSYVHYSSNYDNAFWDGTRMTYGDGSGTYFDILTSIDVAGHEIAHAVCTYTANLAYQRESGALNEAFSDIWGAAVEYYAAPTKSTWLIGEDIERRSGHLALRSMSNPKSEGQPDTYGGTYWQNPNCGTPTQANDYCGVHTNSGVLNHWFYILTVGKSGTNDIGSTYTVTGIGIDKASNITYRLESQYLSANSTYANARTYGIQAAIDLYGAGSPEVIATTNAFYAVGVGAAYAGAGDTQAPSAPTNLVASGTTASSTNLSWSASSDNVGVTGYNVYRNGTLVTTVTGTSTVASGLAGSTTYAFTIKAKDAAGNLSAVSNTATVTTLAGSTTYCASQGNNTADERIGKVVFGSINNTSTGTAGYEDFTSISTSVAQGSTNTITITPSWTSTVYSEGYAVFIDYNQDGDFADAGETVWTKATSTATPASGSFTIPVSALVGPTRMRVSMKYNGVPTSCEAFSYGQVEDYTVNITGSTADTQAPSTPTNLTASNIADTSATLSWNASSDNVGVIGYDVYQGSTLLGNVAGTSANITGLTANTSYTFSVKAKDAAGNTSASSNAVTFTTTGGSTGNSTTTLHEGFFESGWDGWQEGGSDCARYAGSRSFEGTYSIYVRDNSGTASAMTSPVFNLSSYDAVEFKFYFYANSMDTNEDFWVRFYDGSTWTTVATYVSGSGFSNNTFYSATVNLTKAQYNFATNSQFRIQCDASANDDLVYMDQVTVKGIIGTGFAPNSIIPLGGAPNSLTIDSVDEIDGDFMIYPNPVTDGMLTVRVPAENAAYSIINILGQTVLKGEVSKQAINVSSLNPGVYIIEVNDGEEINNQKFIKK